ncbi:hypothetical protein [Clostridium gasigenes]|uniref:Uncharacterized protein n=1 Tax=Clostridium gasigenes TaxID=94869 RepID=A0A1H0VLN4_9CLOT|nr:hypothetical protein [Clostridium gasigenes]MBU3106970.1 hypothetical protein [Clostridium gasigenes]SDP79273.1 hypothetical protein SAMN04488529_11767 [Clostridium gasigenes]
MSNTVFLLANAYEEYDRKKRESTNFSGVNLSTNNLIRLRLSEFEKYVKLNKLLFIMLLIMIISYASFIIFLMMKVSSALILMLPLIICGISMIIINIRLEKQDVRNYNKNRENYEVKLEEFKIIVKNEFEIDSPKKIEYLIKECEETGNEVSTNNNLVKKFLESWKNIIFPIITLGVGYILKLDNLTKTISLEDIIIGITMIIIIIIIILGFSIGVLCAIQSVVDPFLNSYKNRVNKLKQILTDINLRYYV